MPAARGASCVESATHACTHTALVWRDANSPIVFYVCLLLALLMLGLWLKYREALAACKGEGRDAD